MGAPGPCRLSPPKLHESQLFFSREIQRPVFLPPHHAGVDSLTSCSIGAAGNPPGEPSLGFLSCFGGQEQP